MEDLKVHKESKPSKLKLVPSPKKLGFGGDHHHNKGSDSTIGVHSEYKWNNNLPKGIPYGGKRNKSESAKRRHEKKSHHLIAGDLEVKQANEKLVKYLKQCSEINDDSTLSGEIEIDKSYYDGRNIATTTTANHHRPFNRIKHFNGLTNILNTIVDDVVPNQDIYNPFTPVVSPTENTPPISNNLFTQNNRNQFVSKYPPIHQPDNPIGDGDGKRSSMLHNIIDISCNVQRNWLIFSRLCHGFLGGLALAHLLLILSTNPTAWLYGSLNNFNLLADTYANSFFCLAVVCWISILDRIDNNYKNQQQNSNNNSSESISFRHVIIMMVYLAIIILCLTTETTISRFDIDIERENSTVWNEKKYNHVIDIWNSLSIVRSLNAIIGWILIESSSN